MIYKLLHKFGLHFYKLDVYLDIEGMKGLGAIPLRAIEKCKICGKVREDLTGEVGLPEGMDGTAIIRKEKN
jgi:hypothetical protein